MNSIQLEIGGKDLRLDGDLTVTTTDSLLHCLAPLFSIFQEEHPDVDLRVTSDARALDLMKHDADIALGPTHKPPEHWVGRKPLRISCATYAHEDYWRTAKSLPAKDHRWVKLDNDLDQSPMSQITLTKKPKGAKVTVVNMMMSVFDMARSGLGIAAMPRYLREKCLELVAVHEPDYHAN